MMPQRASIFAATDPIDMRRAFDGLAAAARDHMGANPQGGALFVFTNRGRDRLKLLWWDHNGYCILYKRLERGQFRVPRPLHASDRSVAIDMEELSKILEGIELPPSRHA